MKFGLKEHTIDKIQQVFSSVYQVEEAILYGSRAKGNFRNGSDIDLVLKGKGLDLRVMNQLSEKLDDLLLPYTPRPWVFASLASGSSFIRLV